MASSEGQLRVEKPEASANPVSAPEEKRTQISEAQMTTYNDDDIAEAVKDDIETKNESIESDKPTGKGVKRQLTDKQREALNVGRKKRHAASKHDKPVPKESLEDTNRDTVEKKTESLTDDSQAYTRKLLERLERLEEFAVKEREKRKKNKKEQELRRQLKAEIKREMYKAGGGPIREREVVKGDKEAAKYKASQGVPPEHKDRGEKASYVENRSLYDHKGLIKRCFG